MGLSGKLVKNELSNLNLRGFVKNRLAGVRIAKPPVFIAGCGHSGTTMLRHLMGLHRNLYAPPYESRVFFHPAIKIRLAAAVWSFAAISNGKSRWVEKTPAHIYHLGGIFKCYPKAKVILLIRDGRDVSMSLNKRWGNFERSVQRWVEDNKAGEPYWTHPQVLKLNYEVLVADFENQMRAICAFIDEPFDESLLTFASEELSRDVSSAGLTHDGPKVKELRDRQIQSGLYNAKGRWVKEMTEEQKTLFKKMAGEMLIEYGYAADMNW
jgi:hypothetical protein